MGLVTKGGWAVPHDEHGTDTAGNPALTAVNHGSEGND